MTRWNCQQGVSGSLENISFLTQYLALFASQKLSHWVNVPELSALFVLICLCCCRPQHLSTAADHQSDLKYICGSLKGFKMTEMRTVDSWAAESFRSNVSQFSISALLNFYVVLLCFSLHFEFSRKEIQTYIQFWFLVWNIWLDFKNW